MINKLMILLLVATVKAIPLDYFKFGIKINDGTEVFEPIYLNITDHGDINFKLFGNDLHELNLSPNNLNQDSFIPDIESKYTDVIFPELNFSSEKDKHPENDENIRAKHLEIKTAKSEEDSDLNKVENYHDNHVTNRKKNEIMQSKEWETNDLEMKHGETGLDVSGIRPEDVNLKSLINLFMQGLSHEGINKNMKSQQNQDKEIRQIFETNDLANEAQANSVLPDEETPHKKKILKWLDNLFIGALNLPKHLIREFIPNHTDTNSWENRVPVKEPEIESSFETATETTTDCAETPTPFDDVTTVLPNLNVKELVIIKAITKIPLIDEESIPSTVMPVEIEKVPVMSTVDFTSQVTETIPTTAPEFIICCKEIKEEVTTQNPLKVLDIGTTKERTDDATMEPDYMLVIPHDSTGNSWQWHLNTNRV